MVKFQFRIRCIRSGKTDGKSANSHFASSSALRGDDIGIQPSSWSVRAINQTLSQLTDSEESTLRDGGSRTVQVLTVDLLGSMAFSFVLEYQRAKNRIGLWVDPTNELCERFMRSTAGIDEPFDFKDIEALAFHLVYVVIGEPFEPGSLSPPDNEGVQWLGGLKPPTKGPPVS